MLAPGGNSYIISGMANSRLRVLSAAGALAAALGTAVIIGWYARILFLVQVRPSYVPMQYNTALAFIAIGIGLLGAGVGRRVPVLAGGTASLALGALALLQYVFGWNLRIDELLLKSYVSVGSFPPGRLAPNTAVCLILTGVSLLLLGFRGEWRARPAGLGFNGSVVAALGFIALFGYAAGWAAAYGWWGLTPMAIHTAAGFLVIGVGLVLSAVREGRGETGAAPRWIALVATAAVLTITFCTWQALSLERRLRFDVSVAGYGAHVQAEIEEVMSAHISALLRQANRWARTGAKRSCRSGAKRWRARRIGRQIKRSAG